MLTIRLSRTGKTKQASYRFVISEKTKDPWGDSLEILGNFNPRTNPATVNLKKERIEYWLSKGAQTSDTVHNILVDHGVLKEPKIKTVRRKKQEAPTPGVAGVGVPTASVGKEKKPAAPNPPSAQPGGGGEAKAEAKS